MDASQSSILAATRMSPPVISAMLTTVAAFLPLFFIKGIIGQIIFAIPAVVCAVLAASLLEVFLIMPAHLRHGVHPIISNIFSASFTRALFIPHLTVKILFVFDTSVHPKESTNQHW